MNKYPNTVEGLFFASIEESRCLVRRGLKLTSYNIVLKVKISHGEESFPTVYGSSNARPRLPILSLISAKHDFETAARNLENDPLNIEHCIVGYADDLFLMSPTLDGLQKMLLICEKYASAHDRRFSTDPNPKKSKTKCIAFLLKKRNLANFWLCGNQLPWVNAGKHLGMKLENKSGSTENKI